MNEFQMQRRITESTKKEYVKGSKIYIESINDAFYSDAAEKNAKVLFVDDTAQIHCVTEDGQRVTVCSIYGDKFHKI